MTVSNSTKTSLSVDVDVNVNARRRGRGRTAPSGLIERPADAEVRRTWDKIIITWPPGEPRSCRPAVVAAGRTVEESRSSKLLPRFL